MHNVTLKQLRGFITVAAECSFTRAAQRLNISQSSLTITVRDLEEELETRLFERTTRSVELTSQGRVFLPSAKRLLEELAQSLDDLKAVADRKSGSVAVAANASFIHVVLAPAVASLARSFPDISVRITDDMADNVLERVLQGEADFGIATLWRPMPGLEGHLLLKDTLGVLCPRDHPLARAREELCWSDLAPYPQVSLAATAGIRSMIDSNPKVAAVLPKPRYVVSTVSALLALVSNGVGVAVFPGIAAHPLMSRDLVFKPVAKPVVLRELHLAKKQHRGLSPAACELARRMHEQLRELGAVPDVRLVASNAAWLRQLTGDA